MNYQFNREAAQELEDSASWYNRRSLGLGLEFVEEVDNAIQRILQAPEMFERFDGELRRCPVKRFPYQLLYRVRVVAIEIVCVMHNSRRPGYWRHR